MKRYLRKIIKQSNRKFEYRLGIPANVVRKLGLSESIVEITIKEDYFIVKKIGEQLDGVSSIDDTEDDENVTIHY